jgi:hypothetical protein
MSESNASDPSARGNRLPRALVVSVVLACLVLTGLLLSLPRLAQELIVPALVRALQAPELSIDIRRVDFSGLDLGQISLAEDGDITVSAVLVDWSLTGLAHGRIDRVRILGLNARGAKRNGQWEVTGLPNLTQASETDSSPMFLPDIDELHVDGRIGLDAESFAILAPFSVNGSLREGQLILDAQTTLAGQPLVVGLKADLDQRDFRLTCALPPASVAALASLVPSLRNLPVSGTIESLIDAVMPPDQSPRITANLDLNAIQALLGSTLLAQDGQTSIHMAWQNGSQFDLDPVSVSAPLPLILTVSNIETDLERGILGCSWDLALTAVPGLDLAAPPRLSGRCEATRSEHGWNLRTRAELDPLRASPTGSPDLKISLEPGTLSFDVATNATTSRMEAAVRMGRLRLTRQTQDLTLASLDLSVNATTGPSGLEGGLDLAGGRLDAKQPGLTLSATRFRGQGMFRLGENPLVHGTLHVNARATAGDLTSVITARLPLSWPIPANEAGSVQCDVDHGRTKLAKSASRIVQTVHGVDISGTLQTLPVAIRLPFKGQLDLARPENSWVEITANQAIDLPGDLARLVPALSGLSGTARLDAKARLDLSRGVPSLPASLRLSDLALAHGQGKTSLGGGSLGLTFADLLSLRSDPDQRLVFDRLQMGSVILEKGDIRYQIEAPHSILVEGCAFQWAGGRIGSQAFRINPSVEDYTVELYCDRVELTKALEQFGLSQAQGGGTANGRIPVRWSKGSLTFDNGFLYSTPGEKGILQIQGTQILTAGVPPGTPQYGQLDLAAEALKDYAYEWAKIRMNTEGEELVVSLELDGKPAKPLPFIYDRNIGGFARVSAASPGSVFQGIRLDVNFRLPLDQLLQYRQLMELITNGG